MPGCSASRARRCKGRAAPRQARCGKQGLLEANAAVGTGRQRGVEGEFPDMAVGIREGARETVLAEEAAGQDLSARIDRQLHGAADRSGVAIMLAVNRERTFVG